MMVACRIPLNQCRAESQFDRLAVRVYARLEEMAAAAALGGRFLRRAWPARPRRRHSGLSRSQEKFLEVLTVWLG